MSIQANSYRSVGTLGRPGRVERGACCFWHRRNGRLADTHKRDEANGQPKEAEEDLLKKRARARRHPDPEMRLAAWDNDISDAIASKVSYDRGADWGVW